MKIENIEINPIHSTFRGGINDPVQSWYPYLEGYSPDFVRYIINKYNDSNIKSIYDPFAGSGTTPIISASLGFQSFYSEVNPFLQFLINTKIKFILNKEKESLKKDIIELSNSLENRINKSKEDLDLDLNYKNTFKESLFFQDDIYKCILKTRTAIDKLKNENGVLSDIFMVATLSSLIKNSFLKRQGDLRFKKGNEIKKISESDFINTIKENLKKILLDADNSTLDIKKIPFFITDDAKNIGNCDIKKIDSVITSPPYLNGTNYFRNTKVELWFLKYLKKTEDLNNFRRKAITSGINDVALSLSKEIKNKHLSSLIKELEENAYDKRIPKMINDYFFDMSLVFSGLRKHLTKNATIIIDIGDSIYNGVHVKTDEILTHILKDIGYKLKSVEILRKRISKNGSELKQVLLVFKYNNEK